MIANAISNGDVKVTAYPVCETCHEAWVLRLAMRLDGTEEWIWQRDCKHKRAGALVREMPK